MAKEFSIDTTTIIMAVIGIAAIYLIMNPTALQSVFNINVNVPPANTPAPTVVEKVVVVTEHADLRALFMPFIVANPDSPAICEGFGGEWYWQVDRVGCYDAGAPIYDCAMGLLLTAMQQCAAVHATGVCNVNNAHCQY